MDPDVNEPTVKQIRHKSSINCIFSNQGSLISCGSDLKLVLCPSGMFPLILKGNAVKIRHMISYLMHLCLLHYESLFRLQLIFSRRKRTILKSLSCRFRFWLISILFSKYINIVAKLAAVWWLLLTAACRRDLVSAELKATAADFQTCAEVKCRWIKLICHVSADSENLCRFVGLYLRIPELAHEVSFICFRI